MIKCVSFDLDDTLWDLSPVMEGANQRLFHWFQLHAPKVCEQYDLEQSYKVRDEVVRCCPEIAYSVSLVRQYQIRWMLERSGYPVSELEALTGAAFEAFLEARQQVTLFDEAQPMLDALKAKGYRLVALTNGNAHISKVGLTEWMDLQVSPDDVGVEKPHLGIFQQLLNQLGLKPEEVVHVGDNPIADVTGAYDAGLWSVWVNLNSQMDDHPPADEVVTCLSQLPSAIERIEERAL